MSAPERLPFDSNRSHAPQTAPSLFLQQEGIPASSIITVSQLTRMLKGAINSALPGPHHVLGELSNFSQPSTGHLYFTLKDKTSELRCVMWRSDGLMLKFKPADGMEVIATGQVDVYEPRGQVQFYVRRLEPRGIGALDLAFQQLKEKLSKEGLFDKKRKRALPRFPRRIGVVTSPTGAAFRDIVQTIQRRYPAVDIVICAARVQGDSAGQEIAASIACLNRHRAAVGGIDVMIVGRGGGSLEDLWAFNEEVVARAIFASEIPVISAVGHEVDFTIADFVADVRAATPTAAAELVVPVMSDVLLEFDDLNRHLRRALNQTLERARSRLQVVERSEWFRDPIARIQHRQQQIDEVGGRLRLGMTQLLAARRQRVHKAEIRLFRVRPEAQLARRRERLARAADSLRWAHRELAHRAERHLNDLAHRLSAVSPVATMTAGHVTVDHLASRLSRNGMVIRANCRGRLEDLKSRLKAASHEAILKRGFTITRRMRGRKLVHAANEVRLDDKLETQTAEGTITSRVIDAAQSDLFE